MKHKINKESGLAHIGLIIAAVLVVAAIAFGGWYVWDKNKKNDQKASNATSQNTNQAGQKESDPSEGGKYLVIKEWGVRFELPEELRGDVYYQITKNDLLGAEFVNFASQRLDGLVGDGSCTFKSNPQNSGLSSSMLRGQFDGLDKNPEEFKSSRQFVAHFQDLGYYYPKQTESPPITCLTGTDHEKFNNVEQSISNQLWTAFSTLQEIK